MLKKIFIAAAIIASTATPVQAGVSNSAVCGTVRGTAEAAMKFRQSERTISEYYAWQKKTASQIWAEPALRESVLQMAWSQAREAYTRPVHVLEEFKEMSVRLFADAEEAKCLKALEGKAF
jgi:hypothetical protein